MDFRMSIGKGDPGGSVVVAGGHVDHFILAWIPWFKAGHVDDKEAVVDPVFAFIKNDPNARGGRVIHIGNLPIGFELSLPGPNFVGVEPIVHRDAANAG